MRRTTAADPTLGGSYRNLQVLPHAFPSRCGATFRTSRAAHITVASDLPVLRLPSSLRRRTHSSSPAVCEVSPETDSLP